ncbi:hypothetical protein AVEN_175353-1 [Araneus ventricosus]|uniref:Reverse transcriptase domain-containing protein n=1 Tax=Araneus ventricosus TaxID=182803 RepID=A0A4Y2I0E6_ARAVE|nr:hypothetical protein AVEN_175353-1 [Araneus ventricosus]
MKIYEDIFSSRARKEVVILVSLDIQGAYDSIWHDALVYKCLEIGLSHRFCRWIVNFIANRTIKVRWRETFCLPPQQSWFPQGSVLSPFLWLTFRKFSITTLDGYFTQTTSSSTIEVPTTRLLESSYRTLSRTFSNGATSGNIPSSLINVWRQ